MTRNLIVYKVDYANRHEDYDTRTGKFVRTKRIVIHLMRLIRQVATGEIIEQ